jgi:hypothetical protein
VNYTPLSVGAKGALIGLIEKSLERMPGNDFVEAKPEAARKFVLGWLFTPSDQPMGIVSSKELTAKQWIAISRWCWVQGAYNQTRKEFQDEIVSVFNFAVHDAQISFDTASGDGKQLVMQDLLDLRQNGEQGLVDTGMLLPGAVAAGIEPVYEDIGNDNHLPETLTELVAQYGAERVRKWMLKF